MMSAIKSTKNNKALRKNDRNRWKKLIGNNEEKPIEDYIKSTPEQLDAIRTRLQEENKKAKKKQITLFLLFMTIIFIALYFFNQYITTLF